jgi:UMF1 family MFS transporter
MATIGRGHWQYAAVLFVIGNIGIAASLVFYDSLLPHIAGPAEIDRVSTAGYAVGYLGGGLLLVINLLWILTPHAFGLPDQTAGTKLSLASVGVWCLLFSLPLFFGVREPAGLSPAPRFSVSQPFRQAVATLLELWTYRQAFLMLVAFLLYNDGIQTMIRMAAIYATEIGIDLNAQIAAFVMVQFVGVPCSFLFGALADRIGAKRAVLASIVVYVGISVWGYVLHTAWQFFVLAFLVATVQGGSQALSRSLFARMIPKAKSSEYFGFFSVFDKFAGIFGPALYFASVVMFGSSRSAVLSVMLLFIAGGVVLSFVDVAAGEAAAAAETGAP